MSNGFRGNGHRYNDQIPVRVGKLEAGQEALSQQLRSIQSEQHEIGRKLDVLANNVVSAQAPRPINWTMAGVVFAFGSTVVTFLMTIMLYSLNKTQTLEEFIVRTIHPTIVAETSKFEERFKTIDAHLHGADIRFKELDDKLQKEMAGADQTLHAQLTALDTRLQDEMTRTAGVIGNLVEQTAVDTDRVSDAQRRMLEFNSGVASRMDTLEREQRELSDQQRGAVKTAIDMNDKATKSIQELREEFLRSGTRKVD